MQIDRQQIAENTDVIQTQADRQMEGQIERKTDKLIIHLKFFEHYEIYQTDRQTGIQRNTQTHTHTHTHTHTIYIKPRKILKLLNT